VTGTSPGLNNTSWPFDKALTKLASTKSISSSSKAFIYNSIARDVNISSASTKAIYLLFVVAKIFSLAAPGPSLILDLIILIFNRLL